MKLEEKMQQVSEATAHVEAKIDRLNAEHDALRAQLAGVGAGLGELSPDQEAAFDQAIERLRILAA
ncbi:hypothetical protein [Planctomyces sp. SH-PL62]|uniref:hypothetical protein n=1 Tax=Planctomyces sp. SH-PL62 TaxID=1636152 RepID=UPI00078C0DDD|nr:hypothetical protein [Planctomyces sp. SH-PL62]AMV38096.1 hypothetical protein VT85_11705 [Planctomyces sp. SH-PL62]